jgi:hypothetical protein
MNSEQRDDQQTGSGASAAAQPTLTNGSAAPLAKKKPRGRPWPKGVSGNPRGRPRTKPPGPRVSKARHVRTLFLSEELLLNYLGRGRGIYLLNFPIGWKHIVACEMDLARRGLVLTLCSDKFPALPGGVHRSRLWIPIGRSAPGSDSRIGFGPRLFFFGDLLRRHICQRGSEVSMGYRPPKGVRPPQLEGKRTGRPKGSRNGANAWRDVLWGYKHRYEERGNPPNAAAHLWWGLALWWPDELEEWLIARGKIRPREED